MNKNEFAPTAPMGWNSYDYYCTAINEREVKANADYMAEHLLPFGYQYVVIDIEWYSNDAATDDQYQYIPFGDNEMDAYSRFQPSPARFPSSADGTGFTKLAAYIHAKGLKFGIHIMRGIPRKAAHDHCRVLGTEETADKIADLRMESGYVRCEEYAGRTGLLRFSDADVCGLGRGLHQVRRYLRHLDLPGVKSQYVHGLGGNPDDPPGDHEDGAADRAFPVSGTGAAAARL